MSEEGKKTVTIRGVDQELYQRMLIRARETGRTVGELMNEAITAFMTMTDSASRIVSSVAGGVVETGRSFIEGVKEAKRDVAVISDVDELEVTKEEIRSFGRPVSFRNVKRLVFPDLDQETLDQYVDSLMIVGEVVIPKGVNKLKLLQKSRGVKRVTVRE